MKSDENREIWMKRIEEYRASGLSQKTWCEESGVKATSLRYWIMKLNKTKSIIEPDDSPIEFASVSITKESFPAIVLEIKDVKLSINNNYDEVFLLNLIKTLRKL